MAGFLGAVTDVLFGSNGIGTSKVLPAFLTAYANLLSTQPSETEYELYKQQAAMYISTAKDNAALIEQQGRIHLRNLMYKNKLERGEDIANIGAKGGNMSGSNLDVVMQKDKVRMMDEMTVITDYTTRAMQERVNGYRQAAGVYGTMYAKASASKTGIVASLLKGLQTYVGLSARDAKVIKDNDNALEFENWRHDTQINSDREYYGDRSGYNMDALSMSHYYSPILNNFVSYEDTTLFDTEYDGSQKLFGDNNVVPLSVFGSNSLKNIQWGGGS